MDQRIQGRSLMTTWFDEFSSENVTTIVDQETTLQASSWKCSVMDYSCIGNRLCSETTSRKSILVIIQENVTDVARGRRCIMYLVRFYEATSSSHAKSTDSSKWCRNIIYWWSSRMLSTIIKVTCWIMCTLKYDLKIRRHLTEASIYDVMMDFQTIVWAKYASDALCNVFDESWKNKFSSSSWASYDFWPVVGSTDLRQKRSIADQNEDVFDIPSVGILAQDVFAQMYVVSFVERSRTRPSWWLRCFAACRDRPSCFLYTLRDVRRTSWWTLVSEWDPLWSRALLHCPRREGDYSWCHRGTIRHDAELKSTDKEKIWEIPDGNSITANEKCCRCAEVFFSSQVWLTKKSADSSKLFSRTSWRVTFTSVKSCTSLSFCQVTRSFSKKSLSTWRRNWRRWLHTSVFIQRIWWRSYLSKCTLFLSSHRVRFCHLSKRYFTTYF